MLTEATFHNLSIDIQVAMGSPKKAPKKVISNLNIFFSFTEIMLGQYDHFSQITVANLLVMFTSTSFFERK